ncbi:hypothetical protein JZ751_019293 [Albula glossodonta]|uniref:B-cell lymphoma 9 beta-catenin binding domain-containing protein n=1 Tax=Albula glossodonta TaxID=121402 RepID=A0A8T2NV60_9TELE|nr:hypothetical protein JZ751_019293 [Albula glossodonta]
MWWNFAVCALLNKKGGATCPGNTLLYLKLRLHPSGSVRSVKSPPRQHAPPCPPVLGLQQPNIHVCVSGVGNDTLTDTERQMERERQEEEGEKESETQCVRDEKERKSFISKSPCQAFPPKFRKRETVLIALTSDLCLGTGRRVGVGRKTGGRGCRPDIVCRFLPGPTAPRNPPEKPCGPSHATECCGFPHILLPPLTPSSSAPTNQMHSENKLTNHGKQVISSAQSQLNPNVNQQQQQQQGPACNLGPKGVGAGNHGAKANQISPGNPGLKGAGQSGGGVGGVPKGKTKRERSVSMDSGELRDALAPTLEPDTKVEGVMRSKRRCVLEKKQPYSGDEWYSGGETEEDEEKPAAAPLPCGFPRMVDDLPVANYDKSHNWVGAPLSHHCTSPENRQSTTMRGLSKQGHCLVLEYRPRPELLKLEPSRALRSSGMGHSPSPVQWVLDSNLPHKKSVFLCTVQRLKTKTAGAFGKSRAGQALPTPSTLGPLGDSAGPVVGRGLGPGLRADLASLPRPPQQVVYVFTTNLANRAAEAVVHGHADSILVYHQKNVPRTKLEQWIATWRRVPGSGREGVFWLALQVQRRVVLWYTAMARIKDCLCGPSGKLPTLSEQLSSAGTPPTGTPKSQSGTPRPASVGGGGGGHPHGGGTPSSTGHPEEEPPQVRPGGNGGSSLGPHLAGSGPNNPQMGGGRPGTGEGVGMLPQASSGVSPSPSPGGAVPGHLVGEQGPREGPLSGGGSVGVDGLSQEQLEHRERSLQTLRDIERLLLRSGGPGEHPGGPNGNPGNVGAGGNSLNSAGGNGVNNLESNSNSGRGGSNCNSNNAGLGPPGALKKYEEPLQSMISQTQSLGGPGMDDPQMGPHHHGLPGLHSHPHHHHHPHHPHLSSPPGLDMGPMMGPEGLTPEQAAWRKLQEEYYQEKRRQQEMMPHPHHRMLGMGEIGMMRGPPPPYHSKPGDPQWGPPMMAGVGPGMGPGNGRLMDMHPDGVRGPRFLGQMQRGPPGGGGYHGNPPGGMGLPMEAMGHQRPPRPGMGGWPDDIPPNMGGGGGGGGGPFQGCYPPGGGGPPQHLQGDPDRLQMREEIFRMLEKRQQLQGLHRLELDRLAKQQQGGARLMDAPGMVPGGFPNSAMGGGPPLPPPGRGDPMDFPGSRGMMGSPIDGGGGNGPPGPRELAEMNMNINLQMSGPQLHMIPGGKSRGGGPDGGGEMLTPEEISRARAAQNGGGVSGMMGSKTIGPGGGGGGGQLPFPSQQGPFPGGHAGGGFLPQEAGPSSDMFGPDQQGPSPIGGTSRLSHMSMSSGPGPRGGDLGPRCSSELSLNINPMGSPALPPPHPLKSPSLSQAASPLMPSPSAPSLKSPQVASAGPPPPQLPPATTGAGTPSSSIKSPQVMGPSSLGLHSPSGSPGHLKSPAMPIASPGRSSQSGWASRGQGRRQRGKQLYGYSTNSTPISQPGSINPSMPFTSSPDGPPSQNPLSLIMSQMSKYAMPSSTPLYHDAIKTIATSDDEMMPDRPMMPGMGMAALMAFGGEIEHVAPPIHSRCSRTTNCTLPMTSEDDAVSVLSVREAGQLLPCQRGPLALVGDLRAPRKSMVTSGHTLRGEWGGVGWGGVGWEGLWEGGEGTQSRLPEGSKMFPSFSGNMGNHQSSQMLLTPQNSMGGPHSGSQSPMGMVLHGQPQLSHDPSGPMLHSPNPMGMPGVNPAMMGAGGGPGGPDGMGPCNISPMLPQNQMGGFPRMQLPPHGPLHSPQQFHPAPDDAGIPHHQLHMLAKGMPHQRPGPPPDAFPPMPVGDGPDLSDVIRPTPTGIPEFDLSRIIPSDKPSSTLQYFPKNEPMAPQGPGPGLPSHQGQPPQPQPPPHHLKQHPPGSAPPNSSTSAPAPGSSNPHLANLQNMMAEQGLPPASHPSHMEMRSGLGGPRGMGGPPGGGGGGGGMGPMCHPGHMMGRTGMVAHNSLQQQQSLHHQHQQQQQQAMMANSLLHHPSSHPHPHPHQHPHPHPAMMSPQQHPQNMISQQNLMMMQAKQRGMSIHGDPYVQQGPLMSPQGPMMGPPHPQSGMMGPQGPFRQRGMPLDGPLRYGPGNMANMPF